MRTEDQTMSQLSWMMRQDLRDRASGMVAKMNAAPAASDEEIVAQLRVIEAQLTALDASLTAVHLTAKRRLETVTA